MRAILTAAPQSIQGDFDFAPLAVAFIAGASAIAVAFLNSRGETTALRRLKAMNEVLDGLPGNEPVTAGFKKARDLLAERVATRVTGPSFWKRVGLYALGVVLGVAMTLGISFLTLLIPNAASEARSLAVGLSLAAGAGVASLTALSYHGRLRRERETDARRAVAESFETAYRARRAAEQAAKSEQLAQMMSPSRRRRARREG